MCGEGINSSLPPSPKKYCHSQLSKSIFQTSLSLPPPQAQWRLVKREETSQIFRMTFNCSVLAWKFCHSYATLICNTWEMEGGGEGEGLVSLGWVPTQPGITYLKGEVGHLGLRCKEISATRGQLVHTQRLWRTCFPIYSRWQMFRL